MATAQEELLTEQHGAAVTLWLNRPDRLNAFSESMALALVDAIAEAGADPGVRVVILRGRGRAFSAGGDVKQMAEDAAEGRAAAYFDRPLVALSRDLGHLEPPGPGRRGGCARLRRAGGRARGVHLPCDRDRRTVRHVES